VVQELLQHLKHLFNQEAVIAPQNLFQFQGYRLGRMQLLT
jgi:hypothetical protein